MDLLKRLSFLFGAEETVYYRRLLVLLRENMCNLKLSNTEIRMICSGNLGEGVAYPPSDDDQMYVIERQLWRVYDNFDEALQHQAVYMIPSDYSPGFCVLHDTSTTTFDVISSKLFLDMHVQFSGTSPHGPCGSATYGTLDCDYLSCLSSPNWPIIASEWITRTRRHRCPPRELIETIARGGCHVVPIGNPDSPFCDCEWRVSFSLAERTLIHKFNHVQFIVYNFLKLILKRVIQIQVPNVLCSYFLKTTLFYAIENTPSELWVPDSVEECYSKCCLLLYHFIDTRNCPNYFVPSSNMMRRKVNEENKVPLLRIVGELIRCGIAGSLHLCGESLALHPGLSPAHLECKLDIELITGYLWQVQMMELEALILQLPADDIKMIKRKVLSPFLSVYQQLMTENNSSFLRLLCRQVFTLTGSRCLNAILGGSDRNKSRYELYRCGEALLRIGCDTDISSGRLHLANYLSMTGRIQQCLVVIRSVLSKYAPYVISTDSQISSAEVYFDVMCNKGHSLDHKMKKSWAFYVTFTKLPVALAPVPFNIILRMVGKYAVYLHPLVCSYFLQGLCYHRTRDYDAMNNSVTLLEDTVKDCPFHQLEDIFYGRFLLGYMKMLQEDYHISCRCLTSAYLMKKEIEKAYKSDCTKKTKACVVFLACVINHALQLT